MARAPPAAATTADAACFLDHPDLDLDMSDTELAETELAVDTWPDWPSAPQLRPSAPMMHSVAPVKPAVPAPRKLDGVAPAPTIPSSLLQDAHAERAAAGRELPVDVERDADANPAAATECGANAKQAAAATLPGSARASRDTSPPGTPRSPMRATVPTPRRPRSPPSPPVRLWFSLRRLVGGIFRRPAAEEAEQRETGELEVRGHAREVSEPEAEGSAAVRDGDEGACSSAGESVTSDNGLGSPIVPAVDAASPPVGEAQVGSEGESDVGLVPDGDAFRLEVSISVSRRSSGHESVASRASNASNACDPPVTLDTFDVSNGSADWNLCEPQGEVMTPDTRTESSVSELNLMQSMFEFAERNCSDNSHPGLSIALPPAAPQHPKSSPPPKTPPPPLPRAATHTAVASTVTTQPRQPPTAPPQRPSGIPRRPRALRADSIRRRSSMLDLSERKRTPNSPPQMHLTVPFSTPTSPQLRPTKTTAASPTSPRPKTPLSAPPPRASRIPRARTQLGDSLARRSSTGPSLEARRTQLEALQQELRDRRRHSQPLFGTEPPTKRLLDMTPQDDSQRNALDSLREKRRQVLIEQQRRLSQSLKVSRIGGVPRNVKLPVPTRRSTRLRGKVSNARAGLSSAGDNSPTTISEPPTHIRRGQDSPTHITETSVHIG